MDLKYHVVELKFSRDNAFSGPIVTVCINPFNYDPLSTATIRLTLNLSKLQPGTSPRAIHERAIEEARALVPEPQARAYLQRIVQAGDTPGWRPL